MSTYAVINSQTNVCENMIVWDGISPWSPPDGYYFVLNDSGAGSIGWTYDPQNGSWTAPPQAPVEQPPADVGAAPEVI